MTLAREVAALDAAINGLSSRLTELVASSRGLSVNDVLYSGLAQFDAQGIAEFSTSVPAAQLVIFNEGSCTIIATNSSPTQTPPAMGIGVTRVKPGAWRSVPMVGTTFTIYGRPGEDVSVVALAIPQPPAAGELGRAAYLVIDTNVPATTGVFYTHPWVKAGVEAVYGGFTLTETAGAAAQIRFRDGTTITAPLIDEVVIGASSSVQIEMDNGLFAASGSIFIEVVAGSVRGSVRVR